MPPKPNGLDVAAYQPILGSTFVKASQRPILVIGDRSWSRYDLARLGAPHPAAAATLHRLVQQLGIAKLADLPSYLAEIGLYKGVGITAYWVALALLRSAGHDPAKLHAAATGADTTFSTWQHHTRVRETTRDTKRSRR